MRIGLIALMATLGWASGEAATVFQVPAEIESDVRFWARVYSDTSNTEGLIHDSVDLTLVYGKVSVPVREAAKDRQREIDARLSDYRARLSRLGAPGAKAEDPEDERIQALLAARGLSAATAAGRLRFQAGQADQFRAGVQRSGHWRPVIERIIVDAGLPPELAALPHVESSFNPYAYSKAGAAGLWQFTRSTGQKYLRVDQWVDERLDPIRATHAAVRYLQEAYTRLGSWPLAIISYNHGVNGMGRAKTLLGTDVVRVMREYNSPSFGFASRNFYPSFLAAIQVEQEAQRLFVGLQRNEVWRTCVAPVAKPVATSTVASAFSVPLDELRLLNPALMNPVWSVSGKIPAGYVLRIPQASSVNRGRSPAYLDQPWRLEGEIGESLQHVVQPGDTLNRISRTVGVPVRDIAARNGITNVDTLTAGQTLTIQGGNACGAGMLAQG
ncbi:MAG: transglycosylase SLT domain-containing protein [Steroidobacteraceae bacterium]